MANEILIEDLDLSIRAYNSLKRMGVSTLTEVFGVLDKGIAQLLQTRFINVNCIQQILQRALENGYPSVSTVERYIIELRNNPESTDETIQRWELVRDSLLVMETHRQKNT